MISEIAWADGRCVRFDEVILSPATHGLSYATSVFDGIRTYGGSIFKCDDHIARLRRSAELFGHTVHYSNADLADASLAATKPSAWLRMNSTSSATPLFTRSA